VLTNYVDQICNPLRFIEQVITKDNIHQTEHLSLYSAIKLYFKYSN